MCGGVKAFHKGAEEVRSSFRSKVNAILARNLRYWRLDLGWTQDNLAYHSGVTAQTISHYECGQREPRVANLRCLADALGVSVDQLLSDEKYD